MLARESLAANSGRNRRGSFSDKPAVSAAAPTAAPFTRLHKRAACPDRIESTRQPSPATATIQRPPTRTGTTGFGRMRSSRAVPILGDAGPRFGDIAVVAIRPLRGEACFRNRPGIVVCCGRMVRHHELERLPMNPDARFARKPRLGSDTTGVDTPMIGRTAHPKQTSRRLAPTPTPTPTLTPAPATAGDLPRTGREV